MCLVGIYFLIEPALFYASQTYILLKRIKKRYYSSFMCLDTITVYTFLDYTNDTAMYTIALAGLVLVTDLVALLLLVSNLVSLLTILKRWCSC